MKKAIYNVFSGMILGFGASILIHFTLFEHATFFILLPILPIIGSITGVILVSNKVIPLFKLWQVLFIFTIFFSLAILVSIVKSNILESQRWKIANSIVLSQPGNTVLEYKYQTGNGMEVPPNVLLRISSDTPIDKISENYDQIFKKDGWETRNQNSQWKKGNVIVYIRDHYRDNDLKYEAEDFQIMVDFNGLWYSHFKNPLQ
jgi:hypothetical protein